MELHLAFDIWPQGFIRHSCSPKTADRSWFMWVQAFFFFFFLRKEQNALQLQRSYYSLIGGSESTTPLPTCCLHWKHQGVGWTLALGESWVCLCEREWAQTPLCAVWLNGVRGGQAWYGSVCQQTYTPVMALLKCITLESWLGITSCSVGGCLMVTGLHHFILVTLEIALNLSWCKHKGKAVEEQHVAQLQCHGQTAIYLTFYWKECCSGGKSRIWLLLWDMQKAESSFSTSVPGVCLTSHIYAVEQCRKGFLCPTRAAHAGLNVCVPGNRSAPVHSLIHVTCTSSGYLVLHKSSHIHTVKPPHLRLWGLLARESLVYASLRIIRDLGAGLLS